MRLYLLMAFTIIPLFSLAQTTTTTSPSDATNPNMERYCDPAQNSDVIAKIREYETQLNGLQPQDSQALKIKENISNTSKKLSCTYRLKQS
jgi:hypothetical protein